jgi:hypothetical protein
MLLLLLLLLMLLLLLLLLVYCITKWTQKPRHDRIHARKAGAGTP